MYQGNSIEGLKSSIMWIMANKNQLKIIGKAAREIYDNNFTMKLFFENIKRVCDRNSIETVKD